MKKDALPLQQEAFFLMPFAICGGVQAVTPTLLVAI
jgi:hypothetical protein